jgi:hypothetical protein
MTLWGTVMTSELQKIPTLGTEPVELQVDPPEEPVRSAALSEGVRALYQKCQFYDVVLSCGGKRFPAHQAVLAAVSEGFRVRLREVHEAASKPSHGEAATSKPDGPAAVEPVAPPAADEAAAPVDGASAPAAASEAVAAATPAPVAAPSAAPSSTASAPKEPPSRYSRYPEVELHGISNPEAVGALLDFVYKVGGGEYSVTSDEANRDVLRLAKQFGLPELEELAKRRLVENLSTENVVSHLATCEEFELNDLYELVVEECVTNTAALVELSNGMEVINHPTILQRLLVQASKGHAQGHGDLTASPESRKRAGSAGEDQDAKRMRFGTRSQAKNAAEVGGA